MKLKTWNQLALSGALAFCLSGSAVVIAAAPQKGKAARTTTMQPKPQPQPAPQREERIRVIKREGLKQPLPAREQGKLKKIRQ